jgi:hypothetical protein
MRIFPPTMRLSFLKGQAAFDDTVTAVETHADNAIGHYMPLSKSSRILR